MSSMKLKSKAGMLAMVAIATIIIVVVAMFSYTAYNKYASTTANSLLNVSPSPTATSSITGTSVPLTLNLPFAMFNQTSISYTSASPQVLLFSTQIPTVQTLIAQQSTTTPYALSGAVVPSAQYYLLVAPSATGTYGTLDNALSGGSGITVGSPVVTTYQGSYWTEYPISFSGLGSLSGSQAITGYVNLQGFQSETPTLTSLLNSTALPATGTGTGTVTAYFSGWAGSYFGQGYKITRMQLLVGQVSAGGTASVQTTASQTGNETIVDNSNLVLSSVTMGTGTASSATSPQIGNGYSISSTTNTWQGLSTGIIEIGNSAGAPYLCGTSTALATQQFYGIPVLYGQADSASGTLTINLNFKGNTFGSNTCYMALKVFYITPSGSTGSTVQDISIS